MNVVHVKTSYYMKAIMGVETGFEKTTPSPGEVFPMMQNLLDEVIASNVLFWISPILHPPAMLRRC